MKALIFDSSSLINYSMNGLTNLLSELKKIFNGKFIITTAVKKEVIDRPTGIKKFELGALHLKKLLDEGVLEMPESLNIDGQELRKLSSKIVSKANNMFYAENQSIHIIDEGEASCVALSMILSDKKIKNLVVVDERSMRMLIENPELLRRLFEKKLHRKVQLRDKLKADVKFIRSAELSFVAYKKKLIELDGKTTLDALLYASKYKGCAISTEEIEIMKRL